MQCEYHPDREAVATCVVCGRPICDYCVAVMYGKKYCPHCFPIHPMPEPMDEETARIVKGARKQRSRLAAVFLLLLSAAVFLPLLLTWDGESTYFMALLAVAIVSFFLQASLAVKRTGWAWWGSAISWVVDISIVVIAHAFWFDPTGQIAAIIVLVAGPPAGIFLLLGKVSDEVAVTLPWCIVIIVAGFLLIYGKSLAL